MRTEEEIKERIKHAEEFKARETVQGAIGYWDIEINLLKWITKI